MPAYIGHLARTALNKALAQGRILRPSRCEMCGEPSRVQGHHHDYEQRLNVTWLCRKCHYGIHVSIRRGEFSLFESRSYALAYAASIATSIATATSAAGGELG